MSVGVTSRYLDLRALAALDHLRFTTRRRIEGVYSGRHQSRRQGGAGEFVDYREYTGGEDLRRLDWKVLARTGKSFVRLYQDETNLPCTLAVDASGSMAFGADRSLRPNQSKLEYALFLATSLSHIIGHAHDQVALAVLDRGLRGYVGLGGTPRHIMQVQQELENVTTSPTTEMGEALGALFQRARQRGVLLLISDFLMEDLDNTFAKLRLFRHRGWEVVALHLVHPHEEQLPEGIAFHFEGLENDGEVACSPSAIRDEYARYFAEHLAIVRRHALADGIDYRLVSTATPYIETLQGFLVERTG